MSEPPKVEIYYAEICGLCHKAMDYFRSVGVPFEAYELEWDEEREEFVESPVRRELYERCGECVDFVPQIFIDGNHIKGWKSLEPMIESGEIRDWLHLDRDAEARR